jgi:hypothetical protein
MDTTQAETQTEIQVESQAESQAETTNSPTNKVPKATVLVPLYIYPLTEKTWQPLYEVYVWSILHRSLTKISIWKHSDNYGL